VPYEGGLVSLSGFYKDLDDPIEYVQRIAGFNYTTAINYPEGRLGGAELELRQDLATWSDGLTGFSLGANATVIDSQVSLTQAEIDQFNQPNIAAPMTTRDMTNAPERLFNLFLTWDNEESGTQVGLFYTIQGDTLVAGAGESNGNYIPNVYAKEFDTLNLSVFQRIGEHMRLQLQAKNLTDPQIETVYRSEYIGDDVRRTSFTRGIDVTLTLNLSYSF
jgi:outer membrane receptor protein involved in Fe transport